MSVKLNIESEKSLKRIIFNIVGGILLLSGCLILSMTVSLSAAYLMDKGINDASLKSLSVFFKKILVNPFSLADVYSQWWGVFVKSFQSDSYRFSLFVPLAVPLIFLFVLVLVFVKSSYVFRLWFVLNHRFARLADVQKMGLFERNFLVLGDFQENLLGIPRAASILCFGEVGSGKTSSVAVPSILRSDKASVLVVTNSGSLAKYTSGYRAQIGKVFCFNLDLPDDEEKGELYPRWNPLDGRNLPESGNERNDYLSFLAGYFVTYENEKHKDNYWQRQAGKALETFFHFMVSKVEEAKANDYFLNHIVENQRLSKDDKDILLSYYLLMPKQYSQAAMKKTEREKLTLDDYFPIGSWDGIPSGWQGKDLCMSMIADWILKNFIHKKDAAGDWVDWLEALLYEAVLFNYSTEAIIGLRQLISLSKKQRQIIFPMLLKPLMVFRNAQVRERTTGNDFCMSMLRGYKNRETKKIEPVTVYLTANTKSTKLLARLFMETALRFNLKDIPENNRLPILTVMDDAAQMLRVRTLEEAVAKGPRMKMSFLLLCNSLHNMETLYGREALEDLVINTNYKIVLAENNKVLSRQLDKLAVYASKSVQIPLGGKSQKYRKQSPADTNYYHRLAKNLLSRRNLRIETFGYQLVLAEGYYHRPILAKNIVFLKDDRFREKAVWEAEYVLSDDLLQRRNLQDMAVPDAEELMFDEDIGIGDETELKQYVALAYDNAVIQTEELAEKKQASTEKAESGDWWMDEQAFGLKEKTENNNPFIKEMPEK